MKSEWYTKYAAGHAPKSRTVKNCIWAFCVGGTICVIGQGFFDLYLLIGLAENDVKALVPVTLIFIAALTTGFGWFDRLAKHAGAGTLVPITGFANAVASSAIDTKNEGYILGLGAKIFTVAGPVILYGTLSASLYGVVIWVCSLCGVTI